MSTHLRTCPLCEATCGLEITIDDGTGRVSRIRGDRDDVFSHGFICPKGSTLRQLHEDPDRLRTPLVRRDGELQPASWEEAFAVVEARLLPIVEEHGPDAVALYLGNPNVHSLDALLYNGGFVKALRTRNVYSASTLDQRPKEIVNALLYGEPLSVPVIDIDRAGFVVMLGANPLESNGSLATAPDWPGRLKALVARGGQLVVIDPRRTRTAALATRYLAVRPGTDAFLLAALVQCLFADGAVDLGAAEGLVDGVDQVAAVVRPFPPEAVAPVCGVDAGEIRRLAVDLAAAPTAAVYARIGGNTQQYGTLVSWLVDVLNVLTGNLDRPGGVLFPLPAAGSANTRPGRGRPPALGRWRSRVRGAPERFGELPAACLAEEIETPGDGQVRALVTMSGNPALSVPNSGRLQKALGSLEFMLCLDIYVNETSRLADVVLPGSGPLARSHYDLVFSQLAVRNIARWSPPVLAGPDEMADWQVLAKLALICSGAGAGADPAVVDEMTIDRLIERAGLDRDKIRAELAPRRGPDRILDFMLMTGPYGLRLSELQAHPHGLDLGALRPRLPDVLRTASGRIELAPELLLQDMARLAADLEGQPAGGDRPLVLIGRRDLRSNNSWMHNLPVLTRGRARCTLQMHPEDAGRRGIGDGALVEVRSRVGTVVVPAELSAELRRGVVSLPHGWGHDLPGTRLQRAATVAGVNCNVLTDDAVLDPVSGNAVFNGVPVEVALQGG